MTDFTITKEMAKQLAMDWYATLMAEIRSEQESGKEVPNVEYNCADWQAKID